MDLQQPLNRRLAVVELLAQLAAATIACLDNLLQADRLTSQFLTDRPTDKVPLVIDPYLRHITGIIANGDVFTNVGRQGQIQVAEPFKPDAVLLDAPWFGHRQEQEIELFPGLWQPWE